MKKKKNMNVKQAGVLVGILVGVVCGLVVLAGIGNVTNEKNDTVYSWHMVAEWTPARPVWAEGDPGAGASGILEIYLMNSTGTDDDARDTNVTATIEGWCDANNLGYCNADNSEVDIAHTTNFELWVRVRGNSTHCKRDTTWWDSDLRVRVTWADESLSDEAMTAHVSANNSDFTFLYVNFVLTGPYTLTKGDTSEIANIKFEAYY